mmetsp:Transcript_67833/g.116546  ORF Transcript_67833/g.116546 Transcript_67833/m.116546 type:complete len:252 (-) Transcript_67833:227-982(-)
MVDFTQKMMNYRFIFRLSIVLLPLSYAWTAQRQRLNMAPLHRLASSWASDDLDSEEELSVVVRCPETNRVIECFIDCTVEEKDTTYFILHPCDEVVGIVKFDDTGAPDLIDPDSEEMDDVFPVAAALFQEDDDINLIRSATCLTMQGGMEDDEDWENGDDDDDDYDYEGGEEEEEEEETGDDQDEKVEVLGDFEIEEVPYSLVKMMEPVFLVAKKASGIAMLDDDYDLLSEADNLRIAPLVEAAIEKSGIR